VLCCKLLHGVTLTLTWHRSSQTNLSAGERNAVTTLVAANRPCYQCFYETTPTSGRTFAHFVPCCPNVGGGEACLARPMPPPVQGEECLRNYLQTSGAEFLDDEALHAPSEDRDEGDFDECDKAML
jgi:hypothetical protein